MSFFFLPKKSPAGVAIAERIAARVQERNSWSTWRTHTPSEVFQFLSKYKLSMPELPTQKELDAAFPVQTIDWEVLSALKKQETQLSVTWIGHATCLLQMDGFSILTDPIFSYRCAPTQLAGPARYRSTPCSIEELLQKVQIDVVVVSHNHYDHLDYNSIKELSEKASKPLVFVVPLGLADWLRSSFPKLEERHEIAELDWHETHSVTNAYDRTLDITAVPMQHWGSRAGFDRDKTLWCGFSMCGDKDTKALFAGDTGWFEGLKDIGTKYGPYNVAMIPIGAYEPYDFMRPQHNNPDDAVKMMQAIRASRAVPIHWGTFQLTKEYYMEPPRLLKEYMEKADLNPNDFTSWLIGETVVIDK